MFGMKIYITDLCIRSPAIKLLSVLKYSQPKSWRHRQTIYSSQKYSTAELRYHLWEHLFLDILILQFNCDAIVVSEFAVNQNLLLLGSNVIVVIRRAHHRTLLQNNCDKLIAMTIICYQTCLTRIELSCG